MRIKFPPPPPNPEFLSKDFPSTTRSRMESHTKENLVGAKTAPTTDSSTSKENHVSLVRTCLSEPGSQNQQTWGLEMEKRS